MITPAVALVLLLPYSSSAFLVLSPSCSKCKSPLQKQHQPISSFRTTGQHAQQQQQHQQQNQHPLPTFLLQSTNNPDDENSQPLKSSRLEGNTREPSPQEISVMDDMITKLSNAKPYELPNAVSKAIRVVSSPRFFLRIAERVDVEQDPSKVEKLQILAENLTATINAVLSTTEERLDDRARCVENVVMAAAEPGSGEFLVPLSADRVEAMRASMDNVDVDVMDEGFLSTIDAWMNKSQQDGMDGMVGILQKVLQMYAGIVITRACLDLQTTVGAAVSGEGQSKAEQVLAEKEAAGPTKAALFMERLMKMDADLWDVELLRAFQNEEVKPQSILGEVQRTIEAVVLGLENGSMAQRVQAEFLKELVTRIEIVEKQV